MDDLFDPNWLVDLILGYLGECDALDPLEYTTKQIVDFNRNVTVVVNNCAVKGLTKLKRVSEETKLNKLGDGKYSFTCDIAITDLQMSVNFDAKLGIPHFRWHPTNKSGIVSLESITFNIEFVMDTHEKNFTGTSIKFVQRSPVICKCSGFAWPIGWIVDSILTSDIEQYYRDNQAQFEEQVKERVNKYFKEKFDLFGNMVNSRPELKIFTSKLGNKFIGNVLDKLGL